MYKKLASQKYNASSSQLTSIKSFNEKYIYYKNNNTKKKLRKNVTEILVIHSLPMYPLSLILSTLLPHSHTVDSLIGYK